MKLLGTIDTKYIKKMREYFSVEEYSISSVENIEDNFKLDGLFISIEEKKDITNAVEWIVLNQKQNNVLVWVYSKFDIGSDTDLFIELGVVDILFGEANLDNLFKKMRNTLINIQKKPLRNLSDNKLCFLNDKNQSLLISGKEFDLTKKEYLLFSDLYENIGTCLTYRELSNLIWPDSNYYSQIQLANIIFRIRRKITSNELFDIKTVRSKGYMLVKKD